MKLIQNILKAGSAVFGLSAIFLFVAPSQFLELLGLENTADLKWSMQMIGITVFALAGNMYMNSQQTSLENLRRVAMLMALSAALLGLITLMIPVTLTWFDYMYAAIGFVFSAAYLVALKKLKSSRA